MSISVSPFRELVSASAGTGKTQHLSNRIIGLLLEGASADEVLASTFTRKAAGEILQRVLVRLAEGAKDPKKAQALGNDLNRPLDRVVCGQLLADLLADLHLVNVVTLDAFFVRLARSFFQEVGIAPGWTIITNRQLEERLLSETVHAALAGDNKAELLELLSIINRGDAKREIHDFLLTKVRELLPICRQLDPEASDPWNPDFGLIDELSPEELQTRASELAVHLREIKVPFTKEGTPHKKWVEAQDKVSDAVEKLDWVAVLKTGIGKAVLAGRDSFHRETIPAEWVDVFRDELNQLVRTDLVPRFRRETPAMGRLAGLLKTAFEGAQRSAGTYRFEDLTYLLGRSDPTASLDDLHYRLDQKMRHLLLDEFQDTSFEQWITLKPLADKMLGRHADKNVGVIVADTKQSIYGWRGARPDLVREVGKRYDLEATLLEKSWRSNQEVLDFVAEVFLDFEKNAVIESIEGGPDVASDWMRDFTELKTGKANWAGHVCVHLGPNDASRGRVWPDLLGYAASIVKKLHKEMPEQTIGVLVRHNTVVGHLMRELGDGDFHVSGRGGCPLTDSPPVNAILSALRLADHPSDRVARYHVTHTPLGVVVELRDSKDAGAAQTLASRIRFQLLTDGYGPTLAKWVDGLILHGDCGDRDEQRLHQLVEIGHRWDERPTLRPTDFTRYIESEVVEDPRPAKVQVMTVHQAKGLQFDVVVLPELYYSLKPKGKRRGAVPECDRDGRVVKVYPGVHSAILPLFPEIEESEHKLRDDALRDEFSVLYVALTRAKSALHLIVPEAKGGSKDQSAWLIREALKLKDADARDELLLERGDPQWFEEVNGGVEPEEEEEEGSRGPSGKAEDSSPLLRLSTAGPGRNLARHSPSSLAGGIHVDLKFKLRLDAAPARQRGLVVHAWCEQIEWIEDGIPGNEQLRAIAQHKVPRMTNEQVTELITKFRGWVDSEHIRNALSREAFSSDQDTVVLVENEFPFVRRVEGGIQEGFIDRLVLIERDGQVVGAEVLDFKTDEIKPGDDGTLAELREYYRPQITAYCDFVREQYGLSEDAVDGKLVFLEAGMISKVV